MVRRPAESAETVASGSSHRHSLGRSRRCRTVNYASELPAISDSDTFRSLPLTPLNVCRPVNSGRAHLSASRIHKVLAGRIWLWSLLVLLILGCQSTPSGSRALFDLARTKGPRSEHEGDESLKLVSKTEEVERVDTDETTKGASWRNDPVLAEVVEKELADASPERRSQWLARIDSIDSSEIPYLLSERRRLIDAGEADVVSSPDDTASDDTVGDDPPPPFQASDQTKLVQDRTRPRSHPLRTLDGPLQAPTPASASVEANGGQGFTQTAMVDGASGSNAAPQEGHGFIENVLDVFGAAGDRQAAVSMQQPNEIHPAGFDDEQSRTRAEEDRRNAAAKRLESQSQQSVYWQEELDKLVSLLETQLAHQEPGETQLEQDIYLRQHVALKLLYLIGSRRPEALQAIPIEDEAQQEFWTEMMWALSNVFDDEALPNPSERARETVERLRSALEHLTPTAGLRIHHAVFCRQIDGFGNYTLFDADEFTPGQLVLVYAEAENFGVQLTTQGDHITRLQSTLDIHEGDADGLVVFHNELPSTEDICRSRRRDYFHSYRIKLPTDLKPGPHVLKLSVRDEVSHKVGTTKLNFVVR